MTKELLGANCLWPGVPELPNAPPDPAGYPSGDHIALDDDDERILEKVWAEVVGPQSTEAPSADDRVAPAADNALAVFRAAPGLALFLHVRGEA